MIWLRSRRRGPIDHGCDGSAVPLTYQSNNFFVHTYVCITAGRYPDLIMHASMPPSSYAMKTKISDIYVVFFFVSFVSGAPVSVSLPERVQPPDAEQNLFLSHCDITMLSSGLGYIQGHHNRYRTNKRSTSCFEIRARSLWPA